MESRHLFISKEVICRFGTDLLLDLSPFEPAIEPPVFNSIYDYLSFGIDKYKDSATFDGDAEFDDHGNLISDIDDSFVESDDIFDDIDNSVNFILENINESSSTQDNTSESKEEEEQSDSDATTTTGVSE